MQKKSRLKRGMALAMSLVLAGGLLAGSALQACATNSSNMPQRQNTQLGDLSAKYETGNTSDPTIIADVNGDLGGKSYGIYMFASKANTPYHFAKWCQSQPTYKYIGDALIQAYEYTSSGVYCPGYGSNFDTAWKNQGCTATDMQLFREAQHAYVQDQIYQALVNKLEANIPNFKVDNYSMALKNTLWSRGVQHGVGGAYTMITNAFAAIGGFAGQSEAELIQAIYNRSGAAMGTDTLKADVLKTTNEAANLNGKEAMSGITAKKYGVADRYMRYFYGNSADVQLGVYYRLQISEPSDALEILYELNGSRCQWHDGTYTLACGSNYLAEDLSIGATAGVWTLAYFAGGYYTISNAAGQRLGVANNTVALQNPGSSNAQKWVWSADYNSWKNVGSGTYLAAEGNRVSMSTEPKAWSPAVSGNNWQLRGAYYPGMADNEIHEGASSFPVRGVITSASGINKVSVKVTNKANNSVVINKTIAGSYYAVSLAPLDDWITISALKEGKYLFEVTATIGSEEKTVISSEFAVLSKVAPEDPTVTPAKDEYTVTFDPAGGTFTGVKTNADGKYTMVVELGDTYGALPEVTKEDAQFSGWFMEDGTQVAPNSIAAARDHTLTARYGKLYTYTFYNHDGSVFKTGKLPDGALIPNPGNAIKANDSTYVYSFNYWVVKDGETRYAKDITTIEAADVAFVPVFSQEEIVTGGTEGGTTGGTEGGTTGGTEGGTTGGTTNNNPPAVSNYLTGVTPGTSVADLKAAGYTVYSGASEVTGGTVATGMIARSGNTSVTIVVTGDLSGDGKISITDVVKLQSHVVGKNNLSGAYLKAADINRDGKVTITDVVQAAQVTVGKRTIG